MSRNPNTTRRLGILLDLETEKLEKRLPRLLRERLARELDPFDLDLVSIEPHAKFDVQVAEKVLFRVEQRQDIPEGKSWTVITKDHALRTALKEAVRSWCTEVLWVSDQAETIDLPAAIYPKISRRVSQEGLHVLDLSAYGTKVMDQLLDLHPDRVAFLPFEFDVVEPTAAEAKEAAERWRKAIQQALEAFRLTELKRDPTKPFALLESQHYRGLSMPRLAAIGRFATVAEAENAATTIRATSFVVDLATGAFKA